MKFLPAFIPEELIKAIGWTMLHSLWQGAGIALVLAIVLVMLHKRAAATRYMVTAVAMLTFLLFTISTFVAQYHRFAIASSPSTVQNISTVNANGFPVDLIASQSGSTGQTYWFFSPELPFIAYFNQHLPLVVLLWLMGIAVLLLRFIGGLAYIQRLKNYKNAPLPSIWQQRLQSLAQQLQISQPVRLVESALVKVPMVIGFFKPVILLPAGIITGLPTQQIEAILAHELAHIYRKDYIINLMQSLMEVIFFYHPCIWWISARMREEREHCCDDMALRICEDSLTFAKALTNLQTMKSAPHHFVVAVTGKKSYLLYRIKRLAGGTKREPDVLEGFVAALFLCLSLVAVSVSASSPFYTNSTSEADLFGETALAVAGQLPENNKIGPKFRHTTDTTQAKGKRTISFSGIRDNKNYEVKIVLNADTVAELYVNGKQIPSGKIKDYSDLIDELTLDLVAPLDPVAPFEPVEVEAEIEPVEAIEALEEIEPVEPIEPVEVDDMEIEEIVDPVDFGYVDSWPDTTRLKGKTTITFDGLKDGKKLHYKIRMEDGAVKELWVDGKKIPEDQIAEYSDLIDTYTRDTDERQAMAMLRQAQAMHRQEDIRIRQEALRSRHEELRRSQEDNRERMLLEREQIRIDKLINPSREREIERKKMREDLNIKRQSIMQDREQLMRERAIAMEKRDAIHSKREALIKEIQKELEADKLIKNTNHYSFKLNANGLSVDGVQQPASVFEKYKKLVEKHSNEKIENIDMQFSVNKK